MSRERAVHVVDREVRHARHSRMAVTSSRSQQNLSMSVSLPAELDISGSDSEPQLTADPVGDLLEDSSGEGPLEETDRSRRDSVRSGTSCDYCSFELPRARWPITHLGPPRRTGSPAVGAAPKLQPRPLASREALQHASRETRQMDIGSFGLHAEFPDHVRRQQRVVWPTPKGQPLLLGVSLETPVRDHFAPASAAGRGPSGRPAPVHDLRLLGEHGDGLYTQSVANTNWPPMRIGASMKINA